MEIFFLVNELHGHFFSELWTFNGNYSLWQSILVGSLLLTLSLTICWATWFVAKAGIIEYGYPQIKAKRIKKESKNDSMISKLLLWGLFSRAKRNGFMAILCLLINWMNCASALGSCVGYIGIIITKGAGWSMSLLILPPFGVFLLGGLLRFIPDLIWLPSERRRYSWRRRK